MSYEFVPNKKALIDNGHKGKPYVVWVDSKEPRKQHFRVYFQRKDLDFEVRYQKDMYYNAVIFKDLPIRPFLDIDINVKDGDIDEKMAEDIYNRILNATRFTLESLEVPDEYCCEYQNSDCLSVATDHRPGKFSYAVYYENIYFKNKSCLESFYTMVKEQLEENGDGNCIQYFDTPNSNFRLVGCAKTTGDHKRQWVNEKDREDSAKIELCFPNIIPHGAHLIDIHETISNNHNTVEITDELEKQVLALCNKDKYLTDNFTYTPIHNHDNFQFTRISSAPCDLCLGKVHDSQNAYVIIRGETVYRKCYQDSKESYKLGTINNTEPATDDDNIKLNYYSDAQHLYGKDWSSETIHAWFKKCVIKLRRTGRPAWVYIDKNSDSNSLKINLLEQVPWKNAAESRKVKIDGEDHDLANYLCEFSKRPGNSYDDVITYPYLLESDKPNKPDKFNLFPGFPFKHVSDSKNVPYYWVEHLKLIDNGSETLLDWIAHMVQKPFQKPFAVFMMGKKGTGKSLIYDMVCRMLGKALTLQLSDINHICGSFNDSLLNKLFVNLNETTHLTKQHENMLKSLITEIQLLINAKNQAAYVIDNYSRFMITTNEKFGMRVSRDDRRGYYIETPAHQKNIEGYFDKMVADSNNEKNDEPFRLLFNYFANRDISKFNAKKPPMTKFKRELMVQSEDPVVNYLNEFVEGDRINNFSNGVDYTINETTKEYYISSKSLYNDFKRYMEEEGEHRSMIKSNRIFKTKLEQYGINYGRHRIDGERFYCSIINIEHVKDKLKQ